jgi:hypothetical protein
MKKGRESRFPSLCASLNFESSSRRSSTGREIPPKKEALVARAMIQRVRCPRLFCIVSATNSACPPFRRRTPLHTLLPSKKRLLHQPSPTASSPSCAVSQRRAMRVARRSSSASNLRSPSSWRERRGGWKEWESLEVPGGRVLSPCTTEMCPRMLNLVSSQPFGERAPSSLRARSAMPCTCLAPMVCANPMCYQHLFTSLQPRLRLAN